MLDHVYQFCPDVMNQTDVLQQQRSKFWCNFMHFSSCMEKERVPASPVVNKLLFIKLQIEGS